MKKLRARLPLYASLAAAVLLTAFSQGATDGIRSSLRLCTETLIPSLFPFMIAATYFSGAIGSTGSGGVASSIARRLFDLSDDARGLILCAVFGGYPVGARLTDARAESGGLSDKERRLLGCLAFFPAPAFAVTAVGRNMFGSVRTGAAIWFAVLFSGMICGVAASFPRRGAVHKPTATDGRKNHSLTDAVNSAARGLFGVCLWTVAFGAVRGTLRTLIGKEPTPITCLADVTAGCLVCAERNDPALAAAVCAFGGLCVHMQILPYISKTKGGYLHFLIFRLVHALLSYGAAKLIFTLFPAFSSVSATAGTQIKPALTSSVGAVFLALLCCFLVLDTAKKELSL